MRPVPSKQEWIVLFGGAGREAAVIALQEYPARITAVLVPERQNRRLTESVARLGDAGLTVVPVPRTHLAETLAPYSRCNLISIGFPYIVPAEVLSRHPLALNVHPTLLPKYRGPTTGAYILINNENVSGSTVHFMESEVDKGAVVAQSRVDLSSFDTVRSLQRKVYDSEAELLREAMDLLDRGSTGSPQDESQASAFPKMRKPEDSEVDPKRPLIELYNHIRACDPEDYPAFFFHEGEKVCIKLWRPMKRPECSDEI